MKVFIVEDEPLGLDRLVKLLREVSPDIEVLGHAETIKSTVTWLQHYPAPDLIFMDIELADGQCFEIFHRVEVAAPVIFTTSYDEYALAAFKVNGVDYLLKPVRKEELERSLLKYRRLKQQLAGSAVVNIENLISGLQGLSPPREYRRRFLVRERQRLLSIETGDIAWFRADGKLCCLHTHDKKRYVVDYTLDQLAAMLDPAEFFRINRSYLAHFKSVRSIDPYFGGKLSLQLTPDPESRDVIVSKEKAGEFKRWMGK